MEIGFCAAKPNQKWGTYGTEFFLFDETLYLSPILDPCSEDLISYMISARPVLGMSRKDNCLDNAVMEKFFRMLKTELFYLQGFDSLEHFKAELIDFLDYYNNRRIKAKLNGLTPAQHRSQALQTA